MARPSDGQLDGALRDMASDVTCEGAGRWRLSLVNGVVLPARVEVAAGWLELTAHLPESARRGYEDVQAVQVNMRLRGPARVARHFGERAPHVRADLSMERQPHRVRPFLESAFAGLTDAVHHFASLDDGLALPPLPPHPSSGTFEDVERACAETGWRIAAGDGLRVDLAARAGAPIARFEPTAESTGRFVVELVTVSGKPEVCRHAVAALLMAASGAVRLVKGGLVESSGVVTAVLESALGEPDGRAVDDALSALSVACRLSAGAAGALLDERVASEYLALSRGVHTETERSSMEVETCLQ